MWAATTATAGVWTATTATAGAGATESPLLTITLLVAGLGASVVGGLALAALARRRSIPYLLVALAVLSVLAQTVVAGLSLEGAVDPVTHHLAEHLLDVVMVALVIAAVVVARREPPGTDAEP